MVFSLLHAFTVVVPSDTFPIGLGMCSANNKYKCHAKWLMYICCLLEQFCVYNAPYSLHRTVSRVYLDQN
jgi:hypothetical protein